MSYNIVSYETISYQKTLFFHAVHFDIVHDALWESYDTSCINKHIHQGNFCEKGPGFLIIFENGEKLHEQ